MDPYHIAVEILSHHFGLEIYMQPPPRIHLVSEPLSNSTLLVFEEKLA